MATFIVNPEAAEWSKSAAGNTSTYIKDGVYKFMGCSISNVTSSIGYNSVPGSLNVTLVEDTENGDSFTEPDIPSAWSMAFPKGGVGQPVLYPNGKSLQPDRYDPTNVPFYFCGVCTDWRRDTANIGGKTISVTLTDPKDMLGGVQCLLSGFALSQSIGTGSPRFTGVKNVVDIFGYFNDGMESDANEFGLKWSGIRKALEACKVTVNDIEFEFKFTGDAFTNAPSWYRVGGQIIDLISLSNKVAKDAGSDVILVGRRVNNNGIMIEFRGIGRSNSSNPLSATEISNFVSSRSDIVQSAKLGKQYRNQPTSSMIVGGFRNSNYVAKPSSLAPRVDYVDFSAEIEYRLFESQFGDNVSAGSIFPFWGLSDDYRYPLIEPFLYLDNIAFDRQGVEYANLNARIPQCKFETVNKEVRVVGHSDVFLNGDGDSDERPWRRLDEIYVGDADKSNVGFVRGLPLNTEILKAALVSQEEFMLVYALYYPATASVLHFMTFDWKAIETHYNALSDDDKVDWYKNIHILDYLTDFSFQGMDDITLSINDTEKEFKRGVHTREVRDELIAGYRAQKDQEVRDREVVLAARDVIYGLVRKYAQEHMGKRWVVCLPKSRIMQRIFSGSPVPTNVEKPEIEYKVDNVGYWEIIPDEFDGLTAGGSSSTQEEQIRKKFMNEDGRFNAMAFMDQYPTGNASFHSDGKHKILFQHLPESEYRPNNLSAGGLYNEDNLPYVAMTANVRQLTKRPDLAIVGIPNSVPFDALTYEDTFKEIEDTSKNRASTLTTFIADAIASMSTRVTSGSSPMIVQENFTDSADSYLVKDAITAFDRLLNGAALSRLNREAAFVLWAEQLSVFSEGRYAFMFPGGPCMDLKGITIPLTSTWSTYGPWYFNYDDAQGMVNVITDASLVPWNFERPNSGTWDSNLEEAGVERLNRTLADIDYVDSATVSVAGFPEFGLASHLGHNSNITTISVNFNVGGITTTYSFATYNQLPGTFRKSDFDDLSSTRIENLPEPRITENVNIGNVIDPIGPERQDKFFGGKSSL